MQRIIFRQDSKQLNRVNNISVFSGEKDVDFLEFLIPLEYNGIDLSDCNVRMSYVTGNGFEHSFLIDEYKKEELYEDEYFIYLVPVSPRFTSVEGTVNAYLSITKMVDGVEQKILKTGDVEILIRDHLSDSSQLDEEDIEIIDQVVLKAQWAVDAVNHMETEIDEKIATKTNKVFEAVMDEDNIVLDINEYPEVKINDLAVNITNTVRMWVASRMDENDVYWSEMPTGKRVYKRNTDPQTSSEYTIATYQVGDLWIKTVDNVTTAYLLTRITNNDNTPPTYHFEWLNLSDHYSKSEIDTLLNNKQNVLTTEGHLSLINDVLSTGAVKVHQYVDDNTSSYEDFENGDLLVNSNNYADKYIYRAFIDEEDDSKLIKYAISEDNIIVSINDRPTTMNDYDKNLYGKIWVKIQNNYPNPPTVINVSVCVGVNHYDYQYIELQPLLNVSGHLSKSDNTLSTDANKIYEAVMNNNVISTDPADYPGIQKNDIAIEHSASDTKHPRIWFQVHTPSSTISWVELDYSKQRVIKSEDNPPTSYGGLNVGDIWIKYTTTNNETTYQIFICVNMENNHPPYTYTWLELTGTDLSNYYTKSQVDTLLDDKQDTIQNGDGIDIEQDRIISVDLASDQDQLLNFRNGQLLLQVYDVAYDTRVRTAFTEGNNYPLASKSYVDDLMSGATKWEFVSQLPTENIDIHTIYFVPKESAETDNIYDEWVYAIQSRNPDVYDWELLGTSQVDLSNYYTKTESDNRYYQKSETYSKTETNTLLATKVDKVETQATIEVPSNSQETSEIDVTDYAIFKFINASGSVTQAHNVRAEIRNGQTIVGYKNIYDSTSQEFVDIDLSNATSIKLENMVSASAFDLTYQLTNEVVRERELTNKLKNKQDTIDSSHKLSADNVDDTNTTNKFVSATEKQTWNAKAETSDIPTNVSELNNDSGYQTSSDVASAIADKEDKTTISTDTTSTTVSLTLADNHEYRYTQDLTSLTLTMPSGDFIASIVFASGSTPTQMTYDSSIKWSGTDVTSNAFVPQANQEYEIVFWYNGLSVNAVVRGV